MFEAFSLYLEADLSVLIFKSSMIAGGMILFSCMIGVPLITPIRHYTFFIIFQGFSFFGMILLLAIACTLIGVGSKGANMLQMYCKNTFKVWDSDDKLASFVIALDNTYIEVEKNILCSEGCSC